MVRGLASRSELDAFRPALSSVIDSVERSRDTQNRIDDYSSLFTQVTNVWRFSEAVRPFIFSRRFAEVAARLLGVPSVLLYHDQALFKPPGAGRTPWHQDSYYWPLATDRTLTMWLALVDISLEMGPIRFASGSHAEDVGNDLAISTSTDERLASLIDARSWPVWTTALVAGDATFHAGGTLHSAGENRSGEIREVMTIIYYAAGTRVSEPANEHQRVDLEVFLPGLAPGDDAKSDLNPVLYP